MTTTALSNGAAFGGRQPIYVFHSGNDPESGWVAYDALVDGCPFEDVRETGDELVDSCTGEAYPFTGEGLPQYDVEVVDGRLAVELVEDTADEPTSTTRSG